MIQLTRNKEVGLGVWDGQYEHYLDDESKTIEKNLAEVTPIAADDDVSFAERAFVRYVRVLAFVEETALKDEWLLVLLEAAREIDSLCSALLHGVERAGHQVESEICPTDETQWLRGPAELLKNDFGKEMHFEGECLVCQGLGGDNELVIFGGVSKESKLKSLKFTEAWYGSPTSGEFKNFMTRRASSPPDMAEIEMVELSWDEAIHHYSKWVRRSFSGMPLRGVKDLKCALLDHRRENFGKALHLARSLGDWNPSGELSELESRATGLAPELEDAQRRLDGAEQDKEALKKKLREQEEELQELVAAKAKTSTLEEHLAKTKSELSDMLQEKEVLSSEMNEAQAQHAAETERIQQELKDAKAEVQCAQQQCENDIAVVEEEKKGLSQSLERANESQKQAEGRIKALESELENAAMAAGIREKKSLELQQEAEGYRSRLLDAEKQLAEASTENEKVRVDIESQGDGSCELRIFPSGAESVGNELGEIKAKLALIEKDNAALRAKIAGQESVDCNDLRVAQHEAHLAKEKLASAQSKLTSVESQVTAMQSELAGYRRHMATLTSGSRSINVAGGTLPSSLDVIEDYNKTAQKVVNLYFESELMSTQAQERFGTVMAELLKGMYAIMRTSYASLLSSMLAALGGIETLSSMTKATHEAFDVYCKRYWKEVFLKLKDEPVEQEKAEKSAPAKGAELCNANEVDVTDGGADLNGAKPLNVNGFAHSEPVSEINQSHCVELDDEGVGGGMPEAAVDNSEGSTQGTPTKSLQSLFDNFLARFPQGDLESSTFKPIFDKLWEVTIVMFLQRPLMRFAFSEQIQGTAFDGEHHEFVDTPIKPGQDVIVLVPRVVRAPQSHSIFTMKESLDSDAGWGQEAKSWVDVPVVDGQ